MRLLQGKALSERLDEGVGMLDLQAFLELDRIVGRNDNALFSFTPTITGENELSILDFRHDLVAVAVEINGLGNVVLPDDLNLRGPLFLGVGFCCHR